MLPCIVIDFFFNNQPDALIIQIYSIIKLYKFRASSFSSSGVFHCTFGIGKVHAGFGDCFQVESGWNSRTLLGSGHHTYIHTYIHTLHIHTPTYIVLLSAHVCKGRIVSVHTMRKVGEVCPSRNSRSPQSRFDRKLGGSQSPFEDFG